MTYDETIHYLFTQTPMFQRDGASAYKPGLDTILTLCHLCDDPQLKFPKSIHIAGTNGKGSTAHTLAAICQAAGMRTGLFTSPHLVDFRERIRVDGEMVSKEFVVDFVQRFIDAQSGLHPSFFELTTAMAFSWFAKEGVDMAVIEVGLGGRLDSTNIITPSLSIITNISMDHTALLGDTLPAIAAEKAGIIKPGVPVVIGEATGEVLEVFIRRAAEVGAPLYQAEPIDATPCATGGWDYCHGKIHGELSGEFQPRNAATILTAARLLQLPDEAVAQGMARVCEMTGLRGRLTTLCSDPYTLVYDTGHNPGAWQYLGPYLASVKARQLTVVIGFAADKDVDGILGMMPRTARYIFTRPSGNRGMAAEQLAQLAAAQGLQGTVIPTVAEAVTAARNAAQPGDFIYVGGSNFVIADMLQIS